MLARKFFAPRHDVGRQRLYVMIVKSNAVQWAPSAAARQEPFFFAGSGRWRPSP